MTDQRNEKGFSGFDDLVSDISEDLKRAKTDSRSSKDQNSIKSSSKESVQDKTQSTMAPSPGSSNWSGAQWAVTFLIGVIIFGILITLPQKKQDPISGQEQVQLPNSFVPAPAPASSSSPARTLASEKKQYKDQSKSRKSSLTIDDLSYDEKSSIESACSYDHMMNGPAAYNRCVSRQLSSLRKAPRNIDLSNLSYDEKSSIESACSYDQMMNGPAAYNRCVSRQLSSLRKAPRNIDLSNLSYDEKSSIESACSYDQMMNGPAAYNRCVSRQLSSLRKAPRNIDLSNLSYDEKSSIESACSYDQMMNGPAAYNRCLKTHLAKLRRRQ